MSSLMKINRYLCGFRLESRRILSSLTLIYLLVICSGVVLYKYKSRSKVFSESVVDIKSNDDLDIKKSFLDIGQSEQDHTLRYDILSKWWETETRGRYTVLKNFVLGDIIPDPLKTITLTTQSTYQYLYHIEEQCKRWEGPISVGIYAPGPEFALNVHLIYYMRFCGHECIKSNISWHLVYDTESDPKTSDSYPFCDIEIMNFDCTQSFDDIIEEYKTSINLNHSLIYPINAVRNVARLSAPTKYVMAIDIELYPSVGLVSQFLQLVEREETGTASMSRRVYVLPVFELETGTTPPNDKTQLLSLFKSGKAQFFHIKLCDICHNFRDRNEWLALNPTNTLNVFRVTKRGHSQRLWEPFYIGTNVEPLWDERLNWNGGLNKMSQALEMCLLGYDYMILDNAFLVHAPHLIRVNRKEKGNHYKKNQKIYFKIRYELMKRYPGKHDC